MASDAISRAQLDGTSPAFVAVLREHRERSLASGMNAHIPKPVEMSVLREALVRVRGVREVEVSEQERVARLKVRSGDWDEGSVRKLVTGGL